MTDPDAVMRLVREGAVEQFKMHTVSTTVSSSRSSGPECVEPAEFPEMARQGKATYRREQLIWLRTAAAEELQRALFARLEPGALAAARPNRAERRLWLRELADRDDAETFSELVGLIRQGLKQEADLKAATKTEPPRQPGLF